jgi:hypothetical protein
VPGDLIRNLPRERLLEFVSDAAKRWLAHDGLWFQAVERAHGIDEAMARDAEAWQGFAPLEARRILSFLGREPGGGLDLLEVALGYRLYALINEQEAVREGPGRLVFRMSACRVQEARRRKGLPDFPCRPVGEVEYAEFARAVDPRIATRCLACPPGPLLPGCFCAWEFTLGAAR